ncbi:MAG: carboxylating nicotinate-nucleotide diphosphorylase [Armatimonadetes bacterium]|nr:carboxylating nicotinate-nucleotide diphosphorylase [Armatimonadota bacterium]
MVAIMPDALWLEDFIDRALAEDIGFGDITTASVVPEDAAIRAEIEVQAEGVVCGLAVAEKIFHRVDSQLKVRSLASDGDRVSGAVMRIEGSARSALTAERTALNILQRLSGIATLTWRYVQAVAGTKTAIADTRKTTPGMRALEKYAVAVGGGRNHRFGLFDAVLIKDNHLSLAGCSLTEAIHRARQRAPHLAKIEVECATLGQVEEAVAAKADAIMLDNMSLDEMREAVRMAPGVLLEASGGITLETVRSIAETGVDLISVGALTHSAPILPMHMEVVP